MATEEVIPQKVPVDVRILNVADLPARYFVHEHVLAALTATIRSEVVARGLPVPPGAQAIYSSVQKRNLPFAAGKPSGKLTFPFHTAAAYVLALLIVTLCGMALGFLIGKVI